MAGITSPEFLGERLIVWCAAAGVPSDPIPTGRSSLLTLRWREMDSNHRSPGHL